MSHRFSRRDLLKASALGMVAPSLAQAAQVGKRPKLESQSLRFGIIGAGGKGESGMAAAAECGDIVAICDIDANTRVKASALHPRAATFDDYRQMIEMMAPHLDAVVISIPDHNHGPAASLAIRHGLHTYCEKPLTRTVWEARQLGRLAREHKVETQMGNQGGAIDWFRNVEAVLKAGTYGAVKEIHGWTDRAGGWWPQGIDRPASAPVPPQVDWDVWLGPRPYRDYAPGYHPFAWRGWWDFGSGALGDIGCHLLNLPFRAFNLVEPLAISAETSGHNKDSYPAWSIVTYEFGQKGNRPPVNFMWYDGGKKPPQEKAPGMEMKGNGCIIICEKATLISSIEYGADFQILGGGTIPEVAYVKSPGHMKEFAAAIRGGRAPQSNIPEFSGPLTEMIVLGNLAVWASGRRLEWDHKRMAVKGTNEFDSMLKPSFRPGWSV